MPRAAILTLVSIVSLAVGAVSSYFLYQHTLLEYSFASMFLERTLNEARTNFIVMNNIADGKTDQAYAFVEGGVLAQILTTYHFPPQGEEADKHFRQLISKLAEFYNRHPQRREEMFARYPDMRAILESGAAP